MSKKRIALSLDHKTDLDRRDQVKNRSLNTEHDSEIVDKSKVIMSFTGEILDKKRIEELRNKKSSRSHLADEAELLEEEYYFDRLQKKEAMEDKVI